MITSRQLFFVKLGGSLITDKRRRATPRLAILRQCALELRGVLDVGAAPRILFGHGSGSFGHWEASQYRTRDGVETPEQWHGFARVSAAALELNRLVIRSFVEANVPMISLQPAASVRTRGGAITSLALEPIRQALDHGLVPLIFGDVTFDEVLGGTILSTEDIFGYLAAALQPSWIVLLGNAPGVLNADHDTIPVITPESYLQVREHLYGSGYTDVTGGMADKVERMVALVSQMPGLRVRIMAGTQPGHLRDALLHPLVCTHGTLICASPTCAPDGIDAAPTGTVARGA
ncbi:MAG: isopentenyl phosphate kinase [Anaerolineae bacterium]|jgi:isopentenyl phosphate kinase|nr:isopentenyl phosphate kinase [Anaerolineae bacterium]